MGKLRPRRFLAVAALATVAAVLAAGGGLAATRAPAHGSGAVRLGSTSLGKVLTDSHGSTLYLFTVDKGTQSSCYGACAAAWPPLLATGRPVAGTGIKASLLGESMRKDGKHQVTYAGHPLYRFSGDTKAGQTNGEGLKGSWFAVSASGRQVAKKAAAQAPPTTTGSGYGNGGY